ncbi:hypothetical protein K8P10_002001 [Leucobacter sp. Psy1]|uniref:hypothetical protein n=1 Tax=Leucobacter sp. Psy1 TaxID=2875729 RepID=UPI001CD629F3|nr:hypothetical protein [Leucobacter sp. Psy1]UBH06490.1 hypothetical protein K8P10_002001 [Leucobacter sp. Psy1]
MQESRRAREAAAQRKRMPYVQIETDVWAIMRNSTEVPAAMIYRISDRIQVAKYLVMTWNAEPHRRRMIAMYDTLEDANFSVKWDNSGHVTGRENHATGAYYEHRRNLEAQREQQGGPR